jgi:hypothetical protein
MKTKTMTTQSIRNSISRSPLRLAFLLIPLSLAIFTSPVDAERATKDTAIQVQLQVPGCNVNGFVDLAGKIILDTEFRLASNRLYVDAQVRPDALAHTSVAYPHPLNGITQVHQQIVYFLNGLATLTFPGSFKFERARPVNPQAGPIRFEIRYTAHLTYKLVGVTPLFQSASYDNFKVVCL